MPWEPARFAQFQPCLQRRQRGGIVALLQIHNSQRVPALSRLQWVFVLFTDYQTLPDGFDSASVVAEIGIAPANVVEHRCAFRLFADLHERFETLLKVFQRLADRSEEHTSELQSPYVIS